jgi:hypothetical protein
MTATELANDLASALMNKGVALEGYAVAFECAHV